MVVGFKYVLFEYLQKMTVFQVMMIMIYNDNNDDLGGGFNLFYFHPCLGKMNPI